jgi:hypothetical protein
MESSASCVAILISTSKIALSFLLLLIPSLQQNWRTGQNRFCLEARGDGRKMGEMAQTMYAHMNK